MQRLTGLDASFLYFETPTMHMHVCATIVFDPSTMPGGYSFEHVKEFLQSRLHLVPPYRRKLAPVPFNLDHPYWVEDENFDLDYHVRRIGCPAPGTEEQLAEIAGDIASRPLDRTRPLWETWVVEGLENGHVATIGKMHHCTVDGVSGANMMVHLFDLSAEPEEKPAPPDDWKPERKPSDVEMLGRALLSRATKPFQLVGTIGKTVGTLASVVRTGRRMGSSMPAPFTAPRTSFNATVTAHRNVAFARVSLEDVKKVKRAFGTTVNDVVLAVCGGALRRYLEERGELPEKSLIAAVPVSVRTEEEQGLVGTNKVSAMFSSLATDVEDPAERLMAIHEVNKGAKEQHKAIGAKFLQDWAQFAAPTTFSLAARMYSSLRLAERHPVIHNLVISNVPGPPIPLYFAGARLVEMYPLGPVMDGAGLNITVLSYMDTMDWGLIACRELMPHIWGLAADIPDALAELVKAADARVGQ
ncbi:MAG TPA: wax ester/triacylglycerol synthase family O-acyltransferase [Actinomycetota bacterium]|nr:wax ester/triacylglycerol synthase family O-acyltransferase [Actinomycetota bacterium]